MHFHYNLNTHCTVHKAKTFPIQKKKKEKKGKKKLDIKGTTDLVIQSLSSINEFIYLMIWVPFSINKEGIHVGFIIRGQQF